MKQPISIDLSKYKKYIEVLASTKSDLIFKNAKEDHALVALSNIFKHSEQSIFIYIDNNENRLNLLNSELFLAIQEALKLKKAKVNVLLKEKEGDDTFLKFIIDLANKYPDLVNVRVANPEFINAIIKEFEETPNFTVGDKDKFRLEFNNSGKINAFCSFNNREYGNLLFSLFKAHFSNCQNYISNAQQF